MPPSQYQRPETALTKARELIKCDKKNNALEILFDVMRYRRGRQWQKVLEELMLLFVELCVELRKNMHFRKAIYQYKSISIMEYAQSFDQVVRHYLSLIESKTEEAKQKSQSAILEVEDLDILETPESLMLSAVSGEGVQDKSSRAILTPWLKSLWDSYRLVLDLLRGNSKLEHLYHKVATDACDFCVKYGRRVEFRKLSEQLRSHAQKIQSQPQRNAPNAISLSNPETYSLHFETRLRQLESAMELEMYNEAFKTIEDIWNLILISKKLAPPILLSNYYLKASELFQKCGCHVYHAAALHSLLRHYRDRKKKQSEEELANLCARVLCATLAVPLPNSKHNSDKFLLSGEYTATKQKTLAGLLNLFQVPTRQSLVRDLVYHNVLSLVPQDLRKLYCTLETDFQPLALWRHSQSAMEYIKSSSELSIYESQLNEVLVSKTVLQLSQVYHTLQFEEIVKLCPFMEPVELERCIVDLIHNLELPVRVDHHSQAVVFDTFTDLGISHCDYGGQINHVNAPDRLSHQLTIFAQVMQQITEMLEEDQPVPVYRQKLVSEYREYQHQFHASLLKRAHLIEKRKEEIEELRKENERSYLLEEARRNAEYEQQLQFEEENLQREAKERERRKAEEEQLRLKQKILRGNYNVLMENKVGVKIPLKELTDEQLNQFDADKFLEKKAMEMRKKRKEITEKAKTMSKKLDYYTRAVRLEEIPLLRQAIEPEAQQARQLHDRAVAEAEEHSKIEHAKQIAEQNRLIRMKADVQIIISQLKESRDIRYKAKLTEWEELCDSTRSKRMAIRKAELEAKAKEEAERKAREEEQARIDAERAAEQERKKQEEKAAEAAARESALREEHDRMEAKKAAAEKNDWFGSPAKAVHAADRRVYVPPSQRASVTSGTDFPQPTFPRKSVSFEPRGGPGGGSFHPTKTSNHTADSTSSHADGGGWTEVNARKGNAPDRLPQHGRYSMQPDHGPSSMHQQSFGTPGSDHNFGPRRSDVRFGTPSNTPSKAGWKRGSIISSTDPVSKPFGFNR